MKLPDGDFIRIFPDMGVCDPHVHIYNGKAWLFSSHDRGPGQPIFRMDDWRIFSSDDLVNWKLEATVHPEDTFSDNAKNATRWIPPSETANTISIFHSSSIRPA